MKTPSLRLESLETRTLLAADIDLDQLAEQTQKVLDTFFDGDASKRDEAEAAAKKILGIDEVDADSGDDHEGEKKHKKKNVFKRFGSAVKGAAKDAVHAGEHFVDTVTGHDDKKNDDASAKASATETDGIGTSPDAEAVVDETTTEKPATEEVVAEEVASSEDGDKESKKNPLDRVGDLVDDVKDTIGGIFRDKGDSDGDAEEGDEKNGPLDRVKDFAGDIKDGINKVLGRDKGDAEGGEGESDGGPLGRIRDIVGTVTDGLGDILDGGDEDPDSLLGRAMNRFDNILVRVGERGHLFDGLGERDGRITSAVANVADVVSDVVEGVTGIVDDRTDFTPEQEKLIAQALDVIAAGIKGLGTVSSLVGTAVPGVSAAQPILNTAGNVVDGASDNVHGITDRLHQLGNKIGSAGHKVASGLDKLSDRLDPQDEVAAGNSTVTDVGHSGNSTTPEVPAAEEEAIVVADNAAPSDETNATTPQEAADVLNEESKNVA